MSYRYLENITYIAYRNMLYFNHPILISHH